MPSLKKAIEAEAVSWIAARIRRFSNRNLVVIDGKSLATDSKTMTKGLRRALWRSDYEDVERAIIKRLIKPGDKVLEGGGGLGLVSMTIAEIVGNENLLAYEASPRSFALLEANKSMNNFTFEVRNRALGHSNDPITFFNHENVLSSSSRPRDHTTEIKIESDDICDIIEQFRPNTLVLDVEGAEIEVIDRADLSSIDKIIAELHPHIVGDKALAPLYAKLFASGFVLDHANSWDNVVSFTKAHDDE